jgi:hypothetical protein
VVAMRSLLIYMIPEHATAPLSFADSQTEEFLQLSNCLYEHTD